MKRALDYVLGTAVFLILAIIVASVFWQVLSRYILGTPSTATTEISRLLFMWLALLGGAYTFGQARHLAIDLLPLALTGRARQTLNTVILLIVASFAFFVMTRGGWTMVSRTLASGQMTPTLGLPMGYVYGAIPAAGIIILVYCFIFLGRIWLNPKSEGGFTIDPHKAPEPEERV